MRTPALVAAGMVALTAPMAAHAGPLALNMEQLRAAPAPVIVQVEGGCGWGYHPVPGHWSQWRGGWVPPHCVPNGYGGSWGGPYGGQAGPYGGWGAYGGGEAPYGGGRAPYGGGQAPYGGWRNYGNGWVNPQP